MKAFKRAQAQLKALSANNALQGKEIYFEVVKILNDYLSAKLHIPIGSTTPDIVKDLRAKSVKQVTTDKVREFYDETDRIKFSSGLSVTHDERRKEELIEHLREMITLLEKEL